MCFPTSCPVFGFLFSRFSVVVDFTLFLFCFVLDWLFVNMCCILLFEYTVIYDIEGVCKLSVQSLLSVWFSSFVCYA